MDATPHDMPRDMTDYPARARALAPLITPLARDIDEQRGLPRNVVDRLIGDGFFRLLQPKSLGGAELHPVDFTKTTETLASLDASVGWCVCQISTMRTEVFGKIIVRTVLVPAIRICAPSQVAFWLPLAKRQVPEIR